MYTLARIHPDPEGLKAAAGAWSSRLYRDLDAILGVAPLVNIPAQNDMDRTVPLSGESRHALRLAMMASIGKFGPAASMALEAEYEAVLRWGQRKHDASKGDFRRFAAALLQQKTRQFERRYRPESLVWERDDARFRAEAAASRSAEGRYLQYAAALAERAQVAYPRRWRVPTMAPEDVTGDVTLYLLTYLRKSYPWSSHETVPGCPATLVLLNKRRRVLARRKLMHLVVEDPRVSDDELVKRAPSPEALYAGRESAGYIERCLDDIAPTLSKTQARYLRAFRDYMTEHGHLNEAQVAANLGRHRAQALRAKNEIRHALERVIEPDFLER